MIANTIPVETKSNEERGFPSDSYFHAMFEDGSSRDERNTNWSAFSKIIRVSCFGGKKDVSISLLPISWISIHHGDIETALEVPPGHAAYQAFISEVSFMPTGQKHENVNGRIVGIVDINTLEVAEERFLNAREQRVYGARL